MSSPPLLTAATPFEGTLTRGSNGIVIGYINRSMQFSITDSLGAGTFTDPDAFADLGVDDMPNSQMEASPGEICEIRIWNVALSPAQISQLWRILAGSARSALLARARARAHSGPGEQISVRA